MATEYNLWGENVSISIDKERFPTNDDIEKIDSVMPGCQHGWFTSSYQGAKLHYRKFLPKQQPPRGVVVFAHGIHGQGGKSFVLKSGKKLNTALLNERLVKQSGFALYCLDMLGHGFSEGTRFFVPDWKINRDDLANFGRFVAKQHLPETPFFLSGESYGGCLALHVARMYQDEPLPNKVSFGGVIVIAAAITANLPPYPVRFVLEKMLMPLFPEWTPFFMPHPVSPERGWRDEETRNLNTSPQVRAWGLAAGGVPFRLGTAANLLWALEEVREYVIPALEVPFCAIHGKCDYSILPSSMDFLVQHAKTVPEDRETHLLEDAYHDVLGDPDNEQALDIWIAFQEKRLKTINKE